MKQNLIAHFVAEAELRACSYHLEALIDAVLAAGESIRGHARTQAIVVFALDALERIDSLPQRKEEIK